MSLFFMRHLSIRNFGPLKEADLEISRLNVIVGPQSSGKSSVLKVAAFCAWLEKRIELTQNLSIASWSIVERHLIDFYNLYGYLNSSTKIEYTTDCLIILLQNKTILAEWKDGRWNYKKSKIAYIPAERNIVSVVSNWQQVKAADNLLEFMAEWDLARQSRSKSLKILNLGVLYNYDKNSNTDKIILNSGVGLALSSASSGLQSLIPLYVNLYYLHKGQYQNRYSQENYISKSESQKLYELLLEQYHLKKFPEKIMKGFLLNNRAVYKGAGVEYLLMHSQLYRNYTEVKNSQIYLEEPENNLFPPEQVILTEWLIEMGMNRFRKNVTFLATHSPYIVNCFLERDKKDFNLFITAPVGNGKTVVRGLSDEEIQEMYDSGVDVFFNYESFV